MASYTAKALTKRESLTFNNSWMSLHVTSMKKLHRVVALLPYEDDGRKGHVVVSHLEDRAAVALQYPAYKVSSLSLGSETGYFIRSDGFYFKVLHVSNCSSKANKFMINHEGCSLIATDNEGYYYVVKDMPTEFKLKKTA